MILLALILAGVAGVVSHWANRYFQGRTDLTFYEYLFVANRSATMMALLAIAGTEVSFYLTMPLNITFFSDEFFKTLVQQAVAAYALDSTLNRDV